MSINVEVSVDELRDFAEFISTFKYKIEGDCAELKSAVNKLAGTMDEDSIRQVYATYDSIIKLLDVKKHELTDLHKKVDDYADFVEKLKRAVMAAGTINTAHISTSAPSGSSGISSASSSPISRRSYSTYTAYTPDDARVSSDTLSENYAVPQSAYIASLSQTEIDSIKAAVRPYKSGECYLPDDVSFYPPKRSGIYIDLNSNNTQASVMYKLAKGSEIAKIESIMICNAPHGTGSKMLKMVCYDAAMRGAKEITGELVSDDIKANGYDENGKSKLVSFYEKNGFTVTSYKDENGNILCKIKKQL